MANKLNSASTRVDGILIKLDALFGTDNSQSLFAEARATLESFKKMADNLNARIGPIADNLQRFSSGGLRDVQSLVDDARQTMQKSQQCDQQFRSESAAADFWWRYGETI